MLGVLKLGYMKEVSETDSKILPFTVVSRHSQELPAILDDTTLSGSDRNAHLNALKMNCYALIRLLESFETSQTNLVDLDLGGKVIWSFGLMLCGVWGERGVDGKEGNSMIHESFLSSLRV